MRRLGGLILIPNGSNELEIFTMCQMQGSYDMM
jgi:hypothetical protein